MDIVTLLNTDNIRLTLLEANGTRLFEESIDGMLNDPLIDESVKDVLKKAKQFAKWAAEKIIALKKGLNRERQETIDMIKTFFKLLKHKLKGKEKPSKKEIVAAIAQLKDVAKVALVVGVLMGPLPGDEPLLLGLELLARKFGFSVFPSALQNII